MIARYSRRSFVKQCSALGAFVVAPGCSKAVWSAAGASRGPIRVIFYTDVHAQTERQTPHAVMRAAEMINSKKADLVIGGGDLITDGLESTPAAAAPRWDVYMAMHDAINGEHHTVIGNHDLVGAMPRDGSPPVVDPRSEYKRRLGLSHTFYSFDAMGYHFMLLDSIRLSGDELKYHGWISEEQREWVKEQLSSIPRTTPIVLVLHIPLVTTFFGATKGATFEAKANRVVVNNVELMELFAEHNLMLVLQGHLHVSELIRWQKTTFITGGAVCGKWWDGPFHGTEEGFAMVTLHSDHVEWEYVGYGWEAPDVKGR